MASSSKPAAASAARRKSTKGTMIVKLKLSPKALQTLEPEPAPAPTPIKEESPSKEPKPTTATPVTLPVVSSSNGDNPSESNSNTPAPVGTPGSTSMPPPTEVVKKKGVKRSAGPALGPDGLPKPRGKPGPKKRPRLEDGSIDHSQSAPRAANGTAAHKLGPKANQGAINAGLRALDRSGKPCRKWQKGGFRLKTFTGVVWELPRWKAPPRVVVEGKPEDQSTSASGDSSKENKDNSQMDSVKSEKSNSGADVEMGSTGSQNVPSPAPSVHTVHTVPTAPTPAIVTAPA